MLIDLLKMPQTFSFAYFITFARNSKIHQSNILL